MFVPVLKNNFDLYGTSPKSPTTSLKNSTDRAHRNSDSNGSTLRKMSASTPIPQSHSTPAGLRLGGSGGKKGRHKKIAPPGATKHYYYSVPAAVALNHHALLNAGGGPSNNGNTTTSGSGSKGRVTKRSPTFPPTNTPVSTSTVPSSTKAPPGPNTSQPHTLFAHGYFGRRKKSLSDPALAHTSRVHAGKNIEAVKARMRKHGLGFSDESDDEEDQGTTHGEVGKRKRKKKSGQPQSQAKSKPRVEGQGGGPSNCLTALFACFMPSRHSRGQPLSQPHEEDSIMMEEEETENSRQKQARRRSASAGDVSSPAHHCTANTAKNEVNEVQDNSAHALAATPLVEPQSKTTLRTSPAPTVPTPKILRWPKRLRQLFKMNPSKSIR